ncbi:PKD domain-containing protein [Kribbella sp. NBC_00382]|uniref:PKD domain-containing protein n=1 Tax=Kribbella sp. NBC_00382 TaxID=2975967 RepID=UPI002E222329
MSERVFFTRHASLAAVLTVAAVVFAGIIHAHDGDHASGADEYGLTTVAGQLPVGRDLPVPTGLPADADGDEGSPLTTHGSFTDGNNKLTVTRVSGAGRVTDHGDGTWSWSYTSADDASGIVVVRATDGRLATGTEAFGWTAANVAPSFDHPRSTRLGARAVAVRASYRDPGAADTHTAFVRWGDGSTTLAASARGAVTGSHVYAANGSYRIGISIIDDNDGRDSTQVGLRN